MTRIAILQPNYIPWRGYFDLINQVDIFVFLDDVQYTKQDWRNRNKICIRKSSPNWLTIPVHTNSLDQLINSVYINNKLPWVKKHLSALQSNYGRAPYFKEFFEPLKEIYNRRFELLVEFDIILIQQISDWLGIETEFCVSSNLNISGQKDDKLIRMIQSLGGTEYISGPAAQAYLQPSLWQDAGINLKYIDYSGYPPYLQINPGFEPQVSILDLIFMTGPDAPNYIWSSPTRVLV
ncbi:MAG: WbqC family protein [Kordiimonas sp.]